MLKRILLTAALVVGVSAPAGFAASLDFGAFASGAQGSTVLNMGNATVTGFGSDLFVYRPGDFGEFPNWGGICSLRGDCEHDLEIAFTGAVENLTFQSRFHQAGDQATVFAYNGLTLLGSVLVNSDADLDFSGFGAITRLFFDDNSSAAGYGWGEFVFDEVNQVPLPASTLLLITGLAFLFTRRRVKAG